jgi:hypothetical protein
MWRLSITTRGAGGSAWIGGAASGGCGLIWCGTSAAGADGAGGGAMGSGARIGGEGNAWCGAAGGGFGADGRAVRGCSGDGVGVCGRAGAGSVCVAAGAMTTCGDESGSRGVVVADAGEGRVDGGTGAGCVLTRLTVGTSGDAVSRGCGGIEVGVARTGLDVRGAARGGCDGAGCRCTTTVSCSVTVRMGAAVGAAATGGAVGSTLSAAEGCSRNASGGSAPRPA